MSGSALLNLGTRAMFANYAALQATSNNIANANTQGYSRQTVQLETAGGQFSGAGFFGKGVNVTTVARAHDVFLTREAASSRAMASGDQARAEQLNRLEQVFGTGEAGIGHAAGQFLNAFVDVSNRPQDMAARQVALARANDVAVRFRAAGEQMDALQAGVTLDLKTAVTAVNSLAQRVAAINSQITLAQGSGHTPNDLLDQRDQMISEISSYVQVTTLEAGDGSMSLFIGGGQLLVLGGQATALAAVPDTFDPGKVRLGIMTGGIASVLPDNLITGGSIAGLLHFQQNDLADARNLLGQMAAALAGSVNAQQALGLDLSTPASSGAPIFSTGTPSVAARSTNAKDGSGIDIASYINGSGVRVPSVSMTITSPSELRASAYEVRPDASTPGNYLVTRLSDGQVTSIASGDEIDGFQLDVVAPLPVAGDRFLLQPVGSAALNMRVVLADPKGIAAASPVTAGVGVGNTGTATVAEVHAVSTALDPNLTATVTFNSDTGDYDWELRDATTNVLDSSGSATWQAGEPIQLNGWSMTLDGVPKSGDTVTVQRTAHPATDNGNARALTDLRDARIVGVETSSGSITARGESITDAYANALAGVGVQVQSANLTAQMSASVANDAEAARSSKTGVNLDEEAARLIQFQQSYQAAAKMLQVAQSVFDTLLQVAAR
ncbi:flagellar hook-associated protein FlgK [Piscinibacter sp.]|uniref:flagellar hook-associated protein FlgK n=1 Tax=Piscinibacter sp. TaxID=1903157 RepID=UPI002B7B0F38|nr:flagellar hook-associated protein FlgK [Albitalea sp.]HUG20909.1 flagellar hook-associated protein FlgK [Albitalea sp.]